jgi:hypothetical protein
MSVNTVRAPGAGFKLRLPRLGLIGQVLLPAAIVLVAAVSGTAALRLRDLHASTTEEVQRSLDLNLAVLSDHAPRSRHALRPGRGAARRRARPGCRAARRLKP